MRTCLVHRSKTKYSPGFAEASWLKRQRAVSRSARSLSETVCSLAGASATSSSRVSWYARLQALTASSLQGRGSVRRAQTTDKTSPSAIAKIVERGGAIPPRGHRPKSEEVSASPRSKAIARTRHHLRVSETRSGSQRLKL
jgi:hypothetical protein